jgi:hypothetical protein
VSPTPLFLGGIALVAVGVLVRRLFAPGRGASSRSVGAVLVAHYDVDAAPAFPRRRPPSRVYAAGFALVLLAVLTSTGSAIRFPASEPSAESPFGALRGDLRQLVGELRARIDVLTNRLEQLTSDDLLRRAPPGSPWPAGLDARASIDIAPVPQASAGESSRLPEASRRSNAGSAGLRNSLAPKSITTTSSAMTSRVPLSSPALVRSESVLARAVDAGSSDGLVTGEVRPASALLVTRAPLPERRATGAFVSETSPKHDKGARTGHSGDRLEKLTKVERVERPERPSRIVKTEKPERLERIDRAQKPERLSKVDRVERPSKPEKPARPGR